MINLGKKNILGVLVDAVDYEAAASRIIEAAACGMSLSVSALAVHGVMTGVLDPMQRYRLNHLDIVTPDGQPVRWALNGLYKTGLKDRVYGPNLVMLVCQQAMENGYPVYLYGSRPEVLASLCTHLQTRFPGLSIAGVQPSLFRTITQVEKMEMVCKIKESGARMVFVGLGCPRQEVWIYENASALAMPLIAVGAAFDFHASLIKEAPGWMQSIGLEWLFRLFMEPRRLWKRYLLLNPLYLVLLFLQKIGLHRFDPGTAEKPEIELRYG